jgi:uncharacterized Zn finger protein (UPF0148 family)
MTVESCPSCGGKGKQQIGTGHRFTSCPVCGGSGEVDVAKAEREAVAAGYKKVSLPEKPSEADEPKRDLVDTLRVFGVPEDSMGCILEALKHYFIPISDVESRIQELEADFSKPNKETTEAELGLSKLLMKQAKWNDADDSLVFWIRTIRFSFEIEVLRGLLPKKEVKK